MASELGPRAMFVAGGTDLFPKLKRRQFEVDALIGLDFLGNRVQRGDDETVVDAGVTLAAASTTEALRGEFPGYAEAAGLVSSPPLRNAGTIGGNLCVDTRCNYYDMTYEWRKAAGFCIKKDGDICLVAPSSSRCWALSSSDTAPMAIALGALVMLAGPNDERKLPVATLYRDDGIDYLAKQPDKVVTALRLPHRLPMDVRLSRPAARRLEREVISAQSADVDMVSGATYTSQGYLRSLQSALDRLW